MSSTRTNKGGIKTIVMASLLATMGAQGEGARRDGREGCSNDGQAVVFAMTSLLGGDADRNGTK